MKLRLIIALQLYELSNDPSDDGNPLEFTFFIFFFFNWVGKEDGEV